MIMDWQNTTAPQSLILLPRISILLNVKNARAPLRRMRFESSVDNSLISQKLWVWDKDILNNDPFKICKTKQSQKRKAWLKQAGSPSQVQVWEWFANPFKEVDYNSSGQNMLTRRSRISIWLKGGSVVRPLVLGWKGSCPLVCVCVCG